MVSENTYSETVLPAPFAVSLTVPVRPCYISLGQRYPFGRSTGAPRYCLGAPNLLEQRENGLGKSYL